MAEETPSTQPAPEEKKEEIETEESSDVPKIGNFMSPYGIILFLIAGLIDLIGLIILCFGLDDFGILDIMGLIFVGGLMFIGSGEITVTKAVQKGWKKILKRLGLSFIGEIIPWFGGLAPCWTLAVYFHLKGS